jgi:heme-degrading monooxygenase HmoA
MHSSGSTQSATRSKILSASTGYVSHELQRCLEVQDQYLLLVWWRRLEDHTVGFRGSPEYQQWRRLLHHFYDPFPIVEHYSLAYPSPASGAAPRVTGLGGVFFKARDPDALRAWYQRHLGFLLRTDGAVVFRWRELERTAATGETVWNPFPADTSYFDPGTAPFMMNYRVADLDALLGCGRGLRGRKNQTRHLRTVCLDPGSGGQSHRAMGAVRLQRLASLALDVSGLSCGCPRSEEGPIMARMVVRLS